MQNRNCIALLNAKFAEGKNVCVGLDTSHKRISKEIEEWLRESKNLPISGAIGPLIREFNKCITEATKDLVCAYKYNLWPYMAQGIQGCYGLRESIIYSREYAPDVPIILDYKFGDVGVSAEEAADFAFRELNADAVTVNPWGGYEDGLDALFGYNNKCIFVWCRSSNAGSKGLQNPLYKRVAGHAVNKWNGNGNCGLIVGATYPRELECVRKIVGEMPILIPGVGAQGGDLEAAVNAAGSRALFSSSRGVIYASNGLDFAQAAREEVVRLQNEIDRHRS